MSCRRCGGTIIGDGYTVPRHCERVDLSGCDVVFEPDAGPILCREGAYDVCGKLVCVCGGAE